MRKAIKQAHKRTKTSPSEADINRAQYEQQKALAERNTQTFFIDYQLEAGKNDNETWADSGLPFIGNDVAYPLDYRIVRAVEGLSPGQRKGNSIFVKKLHFKGVLRRRRWGNTNAVNDGINYMVRLVLARQPGRLDISSEGDKIMADVTETNPFQWNNVNTFRNETYTGETKVYYDERFVMGHNVINARVRSVPETGPGNGDGYVYTTFESEELEIPIAFSVDINERYTFPQAPLGEEDTAVEAVNQQLVLYGMQNHHVHDETYTQLKGVLKYTFDN